MVSILTDTTDLLCVCSRYIDSHYLKRSQYSRNTPTMGRFCLFFDTRLLPSVRKIGAPSPLPFSCPWPSRWRVRKTTRYHRHLEICKRTLTRNSRLCGKLGDVCGKRIFFVLGCMWVAATSIAAAFAPSEIALDVFRALQGLVSTESHSLLNSLSSRDFVQFDRCIILRLPYQAKARGF